MSLNTAHANNGVLIYSGELIILYCDAVQMSLGKAAGDKVSGSKKGRIYLTSHRIIFINSATKEDLKSFASPFFALSHVELEQPVFGANYIKGNVKGQANGGFDGREVEFKLTFKNGGAIEFGQAMLKVASMAGRHTPAYGNAPPPYFAPPSAQYGPAPPPAYSPPTSGYYGWTPPTHVFPNRPQAGEVYQYDAPPPYPGMGGPPVGFVPPQGATANGAGESASFNAKAAEAAASAAYYDPRQPNAAYVPPPAYNEPPPCYSEASKKNN